MTILHYLTGMASEAEADWRLGKFDELTFATTNLFLMIVSGAATQLL